MSDQRYDAVILGAGLVGPALARALAAQGFQVAMLDALAPEVRGDPDFDGRAYAVAPGSQRMLTALGVWERVAEAGPIRAIRVEDHCADPVPPAALAFDPGEIGGAEAGWMVEDRHLRAALANDLPDGIEVIAPARAASVDYGTPARVVLEDGRRLLADLVVACDGRRSATARTAGIGYLAWSYGQTGLVSAIAHEADHEGLAHQRFFPGGPFAVLPLTGRRSALVWSEKDARAAEIAAMDDEAYMTQVAARVGPRLGRLTLEGRRWSYPLGLALADRYAAPRLALAGDAAHGVHPIAGQGLNMGLRDAAALAEVLVEAARRGEDIGALDVLERYQTWRRFDATAMALGMDGINRLFSTASGPVQALRNLGLGAVTGFAGARRFFLGEASGSTGTVPRLLTGRPI